MFAPPAGLEYRPGTEVEGLPVVRGLEAVLESGLRLISFAISEEELRVGQARIKGILKTQVPTTLVLNGWRPLSLTVDGADYVPGTELQAGSYSVELTAAPSERAPRPGPWPPAPANRDDARIFIERRSGASAPVIDMFSLPVGSQLRRVAEVSGQPVLKGSEAILQSGERAVTFGIVEETALPQEERVSAILKTERPVRLLLRGWRPVTLKVNGADWDPDKNFGPGLYRIELIALRVCEYCPP